MEVSYVNSSFLSVKMVVIVINETFIKILTDIRQLQLF
jgi:hypothetical protein